MLLRPLFLIFLARCCAGAIYHLNESEYHRMPRLFDLDDYESCICDDNAFYCLVRLDLYSEHHNDLEMLIKEYSEEQIRHYNHSYIERGVCVKKTCKSYYDKSKTGSVVLLNDVIQDCLNASLWRDYQLKAKLTKFYYCDAQGERNPPDLYDLALLSVAVTILSLNIAGTLYEWFAEQSSWKISEPLGHIFLSSFSLRQNWKWLTTPQSTNLVFERLQGLHGLRPIVTFLMVFAHSIFTITTFTDNPHELEKSYDKIHFQLIYNGLVLMQIVFVMSGFLLAYNLQVRTEKSGTNWKLFPKVMFLRLCRQGPANAVVLFFTMSWLRHFGSGPLWKFHIVGSVVEDCRRYWWHHLLYANNYLNENSHCLIPTWHLAADTQVFLAGLLLHIATRSRGRAIALALTLTVGIVAPALHVLLQGLDPIVVVNAEFFRTNRNDTFYKMHMLGHNNLAAYVVGMVTGYYVYTKQKKGEDIKSNRVFSWMCWLIAPAFVYATLGGTVFYLDGYAAPLALKLAYAATQRVVMSGVGAIAIISLVFRFNNTLCRILEWPVWIVPSRLTFLVFLIHMNIVEVMLGLRTQLTHVSFFNMLMNHFAIVVLAFVIALPVHLTVEAPINRMIKRFLDDEDSVRKKQQ